MTIGVLALQGAFAEHEKMLHELGASCVELRQKQDLEKDFDGLILPGGESTVQGKLLKELDMLDELKKRIQNGLPVLATCAGLILLAEKIDGEEYSYFGTLPVTVKRNAYGRQLGSFYTEDKFGELESVPMPFIRAPYIAEVQDGVKILAQVNGNIVGAEYKNQIGISFHPEVRKDTRIHEYFLRKIRER